MKITVEVSPESEFKPDGPSVPGHNVAATEFLEWLHDAASVVEPPPWIGSFNDAEDDLPWKPTTRKETP